MLLLVVWAWLVPTGAMLLVSDACKECFCWSPYLRKGGGRIEYGERGSLRGEMEKRRRERKGRKGRGRRGEMMKGTECDGGGRLL